MPLFWDQISTEKKTADTKKTKTNKKKQRSWSLGTPKKHRKKKKEQNHQDVGSPARFMFFVFLFFRYYFGKTKNIDVTHVSVYTCKNDRPPKWVDMPLVFLAWLGDVYFGTFISCWKDKREVPNNPFLGKSSIGRNTRFTTQQSSSKGECAQCLCLSSRNILSTWTLILKYINQWLR